MKLKFLFIILFLILISLSFYDMNADEEENIIIDNYFCPEQNCSDIFKSILKNKKTKCAFFDIDKEFYRIINNSFLIMEKDNMGDFYAIEDSNYAYMHNKFCIIGNDKVLTGSANPTHNGLKKNDNNLLLIKSKEIASIYIKEFDELKKGEKNSLNKKDQYPKIYFCPENSCSSKLIRLIRDAKKSIYFATFSFTDKAIANEIILSHRKGLDVKGVFEKRMTSIYSVYDLLKFQKIDVVEDKNPKTMHNKYFIIDEEIVFTGSYNPTNNGNENNDENIVIIKNRTIASEYISNFERIYNYK
ncbi:MAG: phospholipase D-like domain-containing protein [Nanobdellota archaeon]